MEEMFATALARVQNFQKAISDNRKSFLVGVKHESYYGHYIEIEIRTDNNKYFVSTLHCVYQEDYDKIVEELKRILNKQEDEDDE